MFELLYIWIENYRTFFNEGLSLSNRYKINIEKTDEHYKISLEKNKKYCSLYKHNISNISAIVGKNGTGKSSLVNLFSNNMALSYDNCFVIYWIGNDTFVIQYNNSIDYSYIINGYSFSKDNNLKKLSKVKFNENINKFVILEDDYTLERDSIFTITDYNLKKVNMGLKNLVEQINHNKYNFDNEYTLEIEFWNMYFEFWDNNLESRCTIEIKNRISKIYNELGNACYDLCVKNTNVNLREQIVVMVTESYYKKLIFDNMNISSSSEIIRRISKVFKDVKNGQIKTYSEYESALRNLKIHIKYTQYASSIFSMKINKNNTRCDGTKLYLTINKETDHLDFGDLFRIIDYHFEFDFGNRSNFLKYKFNYLSSGQERIINILSALEDCELPGVEYKVGESPKNQILVMDEPETHMHPEMCRKFINDLINALRVKADTNFQIIISTHSPFLLSDLQSGNIIYLKRNGEKSSSIYKDDNIYASNIHSLLRNNFFMDSTIGEYSNNQIQEIISFFNECKEKNIQGIEACENFFKKREFSYLSNFSEIKYIISIIGEPIVKNKLESMFRGLLHQNEETDELKHKLEETIASGDSDKIDAIRGILYGKN